MTKTKDFFVWLGGLVTAGFSAAADGSVTLKDDFQKFVPSLFGIDKASGITAFKGEAFGTVAEREELFNAMKDSISSGDERTDYNLASILNGAYSAYNIGIRDGRDLAVKEILSGKLKVQGLELKK